MKRREVIMSISAVSIAVSGMQAARARLQASAANVANIASTGAVPGSGSSTAKSVYQPVSVNQYANAAGNQPGGVAFTVSRNAGGYVQTYDPTSPDANSAGMVAMPNIDLAAEMINVIDAKAEYAASAKIVRAADDMQKAAIDLLA
jgi:flagellar basal-body rod protein FlgC